MPSRQQRRARRVVVAETTRIGIAAGHYAHHVAILEEKYLPFV